MQRPATSTCQPDEQTLVQESHELPPDAGIRPQVPGMREAAGSVEIEDDGPNRDVADVLAPSLQGQLHQRAHWLLLGRSPEGAHLADHRRLVGPPARKDGKVVETPSVL